MAGVLLDSIHVLNVDDDPDLADMIATYLETEDERLTVETATSAAEGLKRLTSDIDCIVSDYEMPGQNGITFLEQVRAEHPELPFILYTGKGSEEVASEAISAGVTEYMQKESGTDQYTVLANRITNSVKQYRTQAEVEHTRRRLREITESTTDCRWMFTADWDELLFISGYEAVWNRSADKLKANPQDFLNSVHPDHRDRVKQAMERVSTGETVELQYRIIHGDGSTGWVWVKGEPIFDDNGTVVRVVGFTRDVSDQKEREQELERTSERMAFALRSTNTGIWELDLETDALTSYPNPCPVFDREVETADEYFELIHPDDRSRVQSAAQTVGETGEATRIEYRTVPEIEMEWFETQIEPGTDADGSVSRLTGLTQEITERKEYEETITALQNAAQNIFHAETTEEVAEMVVEAARDILGMSINGVAVYDESEDILRMIALTDQAKAVVGEEPIFRPGESLAWDVFESGELEHYDDVSTEPGRSNPDTQIRSEIIVPLGEHGVALIGSTEASVFQDVDCSLVETLVKQAETALDRIAKERALERSEARYRSLTEDTLDTSDVGTFILDADFEVVWVNKAAEEYFGIDRETVTGANKRQLIHDHIKHTVEESEAFTDTVLATYDDNRYVEEFECHVLPVDERDERWLKHWSQPITSGLYEGGRIEHYTDITDRKRNEKQLRRQNKRLEEFASVVSHDLRNPLTVAAGRVELIQEDCDNEHLETITRAHERMEALIDDLLTLSRQGEKISDIESVNLEVLTERCWQNVVTAEATLSTDIDQWIRADRSRLQQLLENLMRNAVEHGDKSVTITVGELDNGFYIEDNGPGIPEDRRDEVFQMSYSTTDDGTGFGLAIVKQVADAHGWDICLTDGSNGGARFEITGVEFVTA